MSSLRRSWSSFTRATADEYLASEETSSVESRVIVAEVMRSLAGKSGLSVLDLGCGNGATYRFLSERGVPLRYTGVDFSGPLLEAARRMAPEATFVADDVERLERVDGTFDVVLYSHVLEMLGSPQAALRRAVTLAPVIVIRFFEPPEGDVDIVELREMDVGSASVPYIRRTMSKDYYRLMLADVDAKAVDVYRCEHSADQVHVVHCR